MPQDRLRSPRGGHGRRTTSLSDFEFRVWDQYQLSADDFGVMRLSAITVMADNDSLADRAPDDVQAALERIAAVELVAIFEHQGRRYVCQLDWQTFQKVEYPRLTGLPKPTEGVLARCDGPTRRLFSKHPGGWKKKGRRGAGNSSDGSPEHSPKVSGTPPDESPERPPEDIPINSRKPLAVSSSKSREQEQEPAALDLSAATRVLDAFRSRWKLIYGIDCSVIVKPLEHAQLAQHVGAHSEAKILIAVGAFFESPDDYVRKARHPLALFLRDPLRHLAKDAASGQPSRCKHQPPCADDATHTKRDLDDRRRAS